MNNDGMQDSFFFRLCSRALDLLLLNVLFLITSLPLFTIGTSICALYSVCLKMVNQEESYIAKNYFRAFARNFKQSFFFWIVCCFATFIFVADFILFSRYGSLFFTILKAVLVILGVLFFSLSMYVFPLLARFEFSNKEVIRHALHMLVTHIPQTFFLLLLHIPFLFLALYSAHTQLFLLAFFSIIGVSFFIYINALILQPILKKYEKK